jgi:iron complex transport system substrate-binding protein
MNGIKHNNRAYLSELARILFIFAIITIVATITVGSAIVTPASATKTITDQAERTVVLPGEIKTVVAVGAVPPINSFIQAIGEGDTIAEGIPASFDKRQWRYQFEITPSILNNPVLQTSMTSANNEEILKTAPDVIFTTTSSLVKELEITGIPVVYFSAKTSQDVKNYMTLLGKIYDKEEKASEYSRFLDSRIDYVQKAVSTIPEDQKPKVLYLTDPKTLQVPNKICETWIELAGGNSVTASAHITNETLQFDLEQLLAWDPDIIIIRQPDLMQYLYNETQFSGLTAVKNKQIYSTPAGVQIWAGGTPEFPLMVEWAANLFHPDKFKDLDMQQETIDFYKTFFNWDISPEKAQNILDGRILYADFTD